jgi:hypothetical protein
MGDPGKGLIALLLVVSVVMMWLGYRAAPYLPVWTPPEVLKHVNNLAMVFAFYLFGVGAAKGTMAARIRHPQLMAVTIWAVAEMVVINRAQPWDRPTDVSVKGDVKALVIGLVLMTIVLAVHVWLGVWPFGGDRP